jgi:protein SCO1/2
VNASPKEVPGRVNGKKTSIKMLLENKLLIIHRIGKSAYYMIFFVCACLATFCLPGCNRKPAELPLPFYNKPDFTPEWIDKTSPDYKNIHTIPAFSFTNQDGKTITEKTVAGKIYVADFIFTRCGGICPKMSDNMGILQQKFKDDEGVIFLSHSVTPDADSVPVLKKYAIKKGAISGKWHLLTGSQEKIYTLAKKQYYAGDTVGYYQAGNEFLHTENFLLIDRHRRIRGVYNGTLVLEMARLADDIRTLEKED